MDHFDGEARSASKASTTGMCDESWYGLRTDLHRGATGASNGPTGIGRAVTRVASVPSPNRLQHIRRPLWP